MRWDIPGRHIGYVLYVRESRWGCASSILMGRIEKYSNPET